MREVDQFAGFAHAELARAMNEVGADQFAADAMVRMMRRKLAAASADTTAGARWRSPCGTDSAGRSSRRPRRLQRPHRVR